MTDIVYCCERVWVERGWDHQCSRRMVVERNGKPYCRQHDPEAVKAKREEADRKVTAKHDASNQRDMSAQALAVQLGVGTPHYDYRFIHGYTGGLVLTADEAKRLIARLEALRP